MDGSFEYLKSRAGFVLAGMEGIQYRAGELALGPGDRIFLYTDGVPEEYQIVGKIINGTDVGRASEDEFVITSSHGIAISDVALGNLILEYAERDNVGTVLPFMREADIIF